MTAVQAPYGAWRSPITSEQVARLGHFRLARPRSVDGALYWAEGRPLEGGRTVIRRRLPNGPTTDVVPAGLNARTRVHEYGGGAYAIHGGTIFFSNFADQRIYRSEISGGDPHPITPEPGVPGANRYADHVVTPDGRYLICVRERRAEPENVNELVVLPTDGSAEPIAIAGGRDFYSSPRVDVAGARLAWLAWDHPNMPWDGCELFVADLGPDGTPGRPEVVAGGPEEAIVQPTWGPNGDLFFASDVSGWWNLYRRRAGRTVRLVEEEAEFAGPMWVFATTWYAVRPDGSLVCTYFSGHRDRLGIWSEDGGLVEVPTELTAMQDIELHAGKAVVVGGSPTRPSRLYAVDLETGELEAVDDEGETVDRAFVSIPRAIGYPTADGGTGYAYFYPPHNPDFRGPPEERPPLVVQVHGGPTSRSTTELEPAIQFWTSRGIAVVDVNYGGSTGYGRAYRQRLDGRWGIVDTEDAIAAARFLEQAGEVDGRRMAISGGSAGGWTVLCALVDHDVFAAGANYYGVSDLTGFLNDTHKFESRYIDRLVAPYEGNEQLWHDRSPVNSLERLSAPVIVLQGLEDEVVPPSQSEMVVDALDARGIPHAYLAFEGEQHGFRKAETIRRAIEAELFFYGRIFGFVPADDIEPVQVKHL